MMLIGLIIAGLVGLVIGKALSVKDSDSKTVKEPVDTRTLSELAKANKPKTSFEVLEAKTVEMSQKVWTDYASFKVDYDNFVELSSAVHNDWKTLNRLNANTKYHNDVLNNAYDLRKSLREQYEVLKLRAENEELKAQNRKLKTQTNTNDEPDVFDKLLWAIQNGYLDFNDYED